MIKKIHLLLGFLVFVGFVFAATNPQGEVGVTSMVDSETGATTLSQNGEEFLKIPRGFEVTQVPPSVDVWEGQSGTIKGSVYTLKNTGEGAKSQDGSMVKFGNSELSIPLFSEAQCYQDSAGNFYITTDKTVSIKTGSGNFENITGGKFKIDKRGEVVKANFTIKAQYIGQERNPYVFNMQGSKKVLTFGSKRNGNATINFDAERGHVSAVADSGVLIFGEDNEMETSSITIATNYNRENEENSDPPSFDAKYDNGRLVYAQINKGDLFNRYSSGEYRSFAKRDGSFFVSKQEEFDNQGSGVYINDKDKTGYVYGKMRMSSDVAKPSMDMAYTGTSENSWLSFARGPDGQEILIAGRDFDLDGIINDDGLLRWVTGKESYMRPGSLDLYYNSKIERSKSGVIKTDIKKGIPYLLRISRNSNDAFVKTGNVQIVSTRSIYVNGEEKSTNSFNQFWKSPVPINGEKGQIRLSRELPSYLKRLWQTPTEEESDMDRADKEIKKDLGIPN